MINKTKEAAVILNFLRHELFRAVAVHAQLSTGAPLTTACRNADTVAQTMCASVELPPEILP